LYTFGDLEVPKHGVNARYANCNHLIYMTCVVVAVVVVVVVVVVKDRDRHM
jgi:hypothetical protein